MKYQLNKNNAAHDLPDFTEGENCNLCTTSDEISGHSLIINFRQMILIYSDCNCFIIGINKFRHNHFVDFNTYRNFSYFGGR